MNERLREMAEFAGRACGIIAKDLAEISPPFTEAFRRGWEQGRTDAPRAGAAPVPEVF